MIATTPYPPSSLTDPIWNDRVFNLVAPNSARHFMAVADELGLTPTMNGTRANLDQAIAMLTAVPNAGCFGPDHKTVLLDVLLATRDGLEATSEAPTSWYINEDGKVVIPAGCTPCCGLPNGEHYFDCPSDLGRELAREQEEEAAYGANRADWDPAVGDADVDYGADESYWHGGEALVS